MAKVSRMVAATNNGSVSNVGKQYGTTRPGPQSEANPFEDSVPSIDAVRSELEQEEVFSFREFCRAAPGHLYNFTVESCINCCKKSRVEEELSASMDESDIKTLEMKTMLKFHFMNPFEKWKYATKRRFPWKFVIQVASIFFVTTQLVLFATSKSTVKTFVNTNERTFAQLFVIDPKDPDFSNPVPSPIHIIYTNDELFEQLNYTASQFFHLEEVGVGTYGYQWDVGNGNSTPYLNLTIYRHSHGEINPTTKTYRNVSSRVDITGPIRISNFSDPINSTVNWSQIQRGLPWILSFRLDFTVSSIYNFGGRIKCFQFAIKLLISNDEPATGMINMPVDMSVETQMSDCDSNARSVDIDSGVLSIKDTPVSTTVVDFLVIIVAILSIILCGRSLLRSMHLTKVVWKFFIEHFDWRLRPKHFVPLFNLWFVGIIVSNVLVLVGSVMKLAIAYTNPDSMALVDTASIILGLAVFGQWCGLLRFLSYFDKYNMLLITLRLALPSVMRFVVCAGILYISFLLLGWLVLGPYHPKFSDPSTTSECLFSLLNGDDMFETYKEMSDVSTAALIFSKVYLYTFISLFIYVVLSVFISLISDTYETLHDHWKNRPRGLLKDFATDQLGRCRPRSDSYNTHHSIVEQDAEDYHILRDMTVSCEFQPLNRQAPPRLNIQDSSGFLHPLNFHAHRQRSTVN